MEQGRPSTITLHLTKHADNPSHLDFRDTSFFTRPGSDSWQLPSAAEVLERHAQSPGINYGIAVFEDLALVVKFGQPSHVHLDNALTMRALWKAFPSHEVPVPEVFGWRSEENKNFIYMSLVPGKPLLHMWATLSSTEKESICRDLGLIQNHLRRLRPESKDTFIGSISYGPVRDRFARYDALDGASGPFNSIKEFNNWVQLAALPITPLSQRGFEDPYRPLLSDTGDIYFTHADFHPDNIMISTSPGAALTISGIVDWEESGWYPSYWEYCKMALVVGEDHEFFTLGYIDKIMEERYENELSAIGEYWSWRGYP